MDTGFRQGVITGVLSAVVGAGLLVWLGTSMRTPASPATPATRETAHPSLTNPDAPYIPKVGQQGKDVVWVPTSYKLVQAMLDLANVTARDYVIDLGSGDGRTVIAAAKRGARAIGIEFNPAMIALSQKNAALAGVMNRASFVEGDLFKTDLSKATVITMFLLPRINLQLRPRLLDLAPGTRIVSNSFDMGDWIRDRDAAVKDDECMSWCTALLWIVPARVAGTWDSPAGPLVLTQAFQQVSGTLGGLPLVGATLSGDRLTFTVHGRYYVATISGDVMTAADGAGWIARRRQASTSRGRHVPERRSGRDSSPAPAPGGAS